MRLLTFHIGNGIHLTILSPTKTIWRTDRALENWYGNSEKEKSEFKLVKLWKLTMHHLIFRRKCWYIRAAYDKFPDFFRIGILKCRKLLKIQYVIAIHLMWWMIYFYDFRFKWTATAGIGIHPTKAWFSQLVNFKNSIRHFKRAICNKSMF